MRPTEQPGRCISGVLSIADRMRSCLGERGGQDRRLCGAHSLTGPGGPRCSRRLARGRSVRGSLLLLRGVTLHFLGQLSVKMTT